MGSGDIDSKCQLSGTHLLDDCAHLVGPTTGAELHTWGLIWGFPKIRGTFLGVPIIRTIAFWGLYWGPPILGNYHITGIGELYMDHGS